MSVRYWKAPLGAAAVAGWIALGLGAAPRAFAAGQGGGPAVTLAPASLTFASQPLGVASAAQTVTLTNSGSADLDISSISIADHDFSETNNCPSPLAAGAACQIMVTFSPLIFGPRNGSLVIADNASDSPQSVSLAGTGMGPAVTLSATVLNFPNQLATSTSAAQTVTLTNTGDGALSISSVTLLGTFGETNNCPVAPATLAVGGACTFTITFQPLTGGQAVGLIEITDNASPVPQAITLNGVGEDFTLAISPSSNSVAPGQSASYTVTATPQGGFNQSVSFSCSALPAGASCSFSPNSITLDGTNPGSSKVTVSTTAGSLGPPVGKFRPGPPAGSIRILALWLLAAGMAAALALRRRRARLALAAVLLGLLLAAAMPGCGGGGSSSGGGGTPAGSYSILVTGGVTGTGLAVPASFTLVVQ